MTRLPTIQDILLLPASPAADASARAVGLVTSDGRVAWGDLPPLPPTLSTTAVEQSLAQAVRPLLLRQPLDSFRRLAAPLDALQETVTSVEVLPPEPTGPPRRSRRDLFTSLVNPTVETPPAPRTREVAHEQPLHPALRYALSVALLTAVAAAHERTAAAQLIADYNLPPADAAPAALPLLADTFIGDSVGRQRAVAARAAAVGLSAPGTNPAGELGERGERLHQLVTAFAGEVAAAGDDATGEPAAGGPAYQPRLFLDLAGGLGALHDGQAGKIFGSLFEMAAVGAPATLAFVDPAVGADAAQHLALLHRLKGSLRRRKVDVTLVAGLGVDSPAGVAAVLEADAAHAVRLTAPALGSLDQTIQAVLAARGAGAGILLAPGPAPTDRALRALLHVALAVQPDYFITPPGAAAYDRVRHALAEVTAEVGARGAPPRREAAP